jgi:hypothetical protein
MKMPVTTEFESGKIHAYTGDLIRELEEAAVNFQIASLVVKFADHYEMIYNHDEQKLTKLDSLVEQGGNPIGFIGVVVIEDAPIQVFLRPLTDFADDLTVKTYLTKAVDQLAEQMTELVSMLRTKMSNGATGPVN